MSDHSRPWPRTTGSSSRIFTSSSAQVEAVRGVDLRIKRGEAVVVIGPSGSGKEHRATLHQSPGDTHVGPCLRGRRRLEDQQDQHQPDAARGRHGLSAVQPVSAPDGAGEHHAGAAHGPQALACGGRAHRYAATGAGRHSRKGRQLSRPAVGRPAAARGHRALPGDAAQSHALRRADLGARPRDDQRGARRDAGPGPRRA